MKVSGHIYALAVLISERDPVAVEFETCWGPRDGLDVLETRIQTSKEM
jgi:hypothetical protein